MVLQDLESKRDNKIIFYVSWSVKQEFWLLFTDIQGGGLNIRVEMKSKLSTGAGALV